MGMTDDSLKIEYIPLSELVGKMHPENPKGHDIGQIIESYKTHGYVASGVLDDRTGLMLAGHGRIEALAMMRKQNTPAPDGIRNGGDDWFVPVQTGYASKDDMHAKAYLIADNRLTTLGGWDETQLAEILQELANSDEIDIEASGYSGDDLDELLRDLAADIIPAEDPGAQIDKAAELNKVWQVKRGDVWQIPSVSGEGVHRIMCGDSTCAEDVGLLMGGVKADAIVTDPPYGMNLQTNRRHGDSSNFLREKRDYNLVINDDVDFDRGSINIFAHDEFWFGADYYVDTLSNCGKDGSWLVWNKRAAGGNEKMQGSMFELIWSKQKHRREVLHFVWNGVLGHIKSIDGAQKYHPTQKSVKMINYILEKWCGNIIIDPYLGSGTTIVAAEQTGRVGYGIEISPDYVAVCLQRLSDMGLQPERIE